MAEKLKQGDMIEFFHGGYQHWAIYIGQYEVIHLVPDGQEGSLGSLALLACKARVKRQKLSKVAGERGFKVNNQLDDQYRARDRNVIVKEACEMEGQVLAYNIATYNCEHFVTDLRYGKPQSRQVKEVAEVAGMVLAGAAIIGLGAALFSSLSDNKEEEDRERRRNSRRHQNWQ